MNLQFKLTGLPYKATGKGGNVIIQGLPANTNVFYDGAESGEDDDDEVTANTEYSSIQFANAKFSPLDSNGNASVFTAGIITDLGTLSYTLPATSFASLDGATIAETFYSDLAPRASEFGASVALAGGTLEFTFDPNDTVTLGGVVFGTTAPTDGVIGGVTTAVPEPSTWLLAAVGFGLAGALSRARRARPKQSVTCLSTRLRCVRRRAGANPTGFGSRD